MTQSDRKSIVAIDPLKLDLECIRLPSSLLQWADHVSMCKFEVDRLKAVLEVKEAQTAALVRQAPEDFGLDSVTEKGVASVVARNSKVLAVAGELAKARLELDQAQAVVGALECKKRSLSLLVELHAIGYFSSPRISKEGQEVVQRMTQRALSRRSRDDAS